jgi:hypothetical protein
LDLKSNIEAHGRKMHDMPVVIQFNKRDLPNKRPDKEIAQMAQRGQEPVFAAIATQGVGVLETFISLLHLTWMSLDGTHGLGKKFHIDSGAFLQEVLQRMGSSKSLDQILDSRLGGDFRVRGKEIRR